MDLLVSIKNIFSLQKGHERTIKAKKNIFLSFIIRGLNMLVSYLIVPLTIDYLDPTRYGIWITITSIVAWLSFFDVGLGHGLRNKFSEAISKGDLVDAKKYVSTSYIVLSFVVIGMLFVFFTLNFFLNWNIILNVDQKLVPLNELKLLISVVVVCFGVNLVFQLINTILTADQEPSKASFNDLVGKFLSLICIWLLLKTTSSSLLLLGTVISIVPVITFLIISVYHFNDNYKYYRPQIKFYDKSKINDLLKLSLKFFIIRISAILFYSTNNIIISHLFGPSEVTPYSIALSFFNILLLLFNIVVSPFWSAFTEAWVKKEIEWIKNTMNYLFYFWIGLGILGFLMVLSSKYVFLFWIGDKVQIPVLLSSLVCVWILFVTWNGIYSQFLYGIGAIKIQSYLAFVLAIINIPLAILLGKIYSINGILIANILCTLPQMIIYSIQYKKIINFKAQGVWVN